MEKPGIVLETKRLYIRPVQEMDKDAYMSIRVKNSDFTSAYHIWTEFYDEEWKCELESEDSVYLSVFQKDDYVLVASASVQNYGHDTIELGYDVAEEYRNRGFATELLRALTVWVHEEFPGIPVRVRIRSDNAASRRVVEKCGGRLSGNEDSVIVKEILQILKETNVKLTEPGMENIMKRIEEGKDQVLVYEV